MPKHLTTPNTYTTLVAKIARELSDIEFFVKRRALSQAVEKINHA